MEDELTATWYVARCCSETGIIPTSIFGHPEVYIERNHYQKSRTTQWTKCDRFLTSILTLFLSSTARAVHLIFYVNVQKIVTMPVILKTTPMKVWCGFKGRSPMFFKAPLFSGRSILYSGESNCRKELSKVIEKGFRPYSVLCDNDRAI